MAWRSTNEKQNRIEDATSASRRRKGRAAITREAINESYNLKDVISGLDTKLQSTQRELEQAIEARSRDTMLAEMHETNARSLSGTMPQPPPPQPSIPADFVAQFQDVMMRERTETTTLLDNRLEAFSDLAAEHRDRSIRDELR